LWAGIVIMGLFSFAESPQLQALLADIAPPSTRDASYALYFTLAFGVGSLWTAVYGVIIDVLGEPIGVPIVFVLMGVAFLAAALTTLPIRTEGRPRDRLDEDPGTALAG
jgi:MFS family permease